MAEPLITIIIPVFQEEGHIYNNIKVVHEILVKNDITHELLLVEDGSRDGTWGVITKISAEISTIRAYRLSRNFGKEAALCAGLEHAKGDACIIMDADLQHPPELIPEMVRLWKTGEYDVIEGVKSSRGKERLLNKFGAYSFYSILRRLSGLDLNKASDFKLLDYRVIEAWRQMGERVTFFRGMSAWVGFRRIAIPFVVADRLHGMSKWSFGRLFKLAVIAITAFSSAPLQIVTFIGVLFLIGSVIMGIQTLYMKLANIAFSGFTTVILLLLIIGSTIMISLGIIGTYIARIFDEVKARPRYIISEAIVDEEKGNTRE